MAKAYIRIDPSSVRLGHRELRVEQPGTCIFLTYHYVKVTQRWKILLPAAAICGINKPYAFSAAHGTVFALLGPQKIMTRGGQSMFFDEEEDSVVSEDSTILLMHDDQTTIQIKTALLRYLGYSVETVMAGEEAVALYKARKEEGRPFKAVILDVCQPHGIGGREAVKDLMEYDPEIKAIASSGLGDYKIMTEPDEYGDRASLFKPYNLRQLGVALRNSAGTGNRPWDPP